MMDQVADSIDALPFQNTINSRKAGHKAVRYGYEKEEVAT